RHRFWKGSLPQARDAWNKAAAAAPLDVRTRCYQVASSAHPRWIVPFRRLSNIVTAAPRASRRPANNLLHDTMYRRARSVTVGAVHKLDAIWGRVADGQVRVLFEAASPVSLAVFQPVFDRLRRDPRLQFWFTTSDTWSGTAIFGGIGMDDRIISPRRARWMKFDAYINTDFWSMTWLPRCPLRIHLFHGVAGKYGLDAPVHIAPVVSTFDRLLFPNRDR